MTGIADDHDATIILVRDEYQRLQKHNPTHELLKYIFNVNNEEFDTKHISEFLEKYDKNKKSPWVVVLANYYIDLRNAVDKIEGIDRSQEKPKLPKLEKIIKGEDDLPF